MKAERQTRSVSRALRRLFNVTGARTGSLMMGLVFPALGTSLLARAFAGQLVLQNLNDEPAEKLLAQIRQSGRCPG